MSANKCYRNPSWLLLFVIPIIRFLRLTTILQRFFRPSAIGHRPSFLAAFLLLTSFPALAQDSIFHRVIILGDAGELTKQQKIVVADASSKIITGKTTVLYLGDNIYPRGMGGLPGSAEENSAIGILASQYKPMREKGAPVYFIPGNHDWDRMGKNGLQKIKKQWEYLQRQGDDSLALIPPNGCPDPIALQVSDNLTIIAFDSEWWLFPFDKSNSVADCDCNSKEEIIAKLDELFAKNKDKTILLASHHPFRSYGKHGGYFSWKDHIFPLTEANKNLYIPLPVIGSLYPILRKIFTNPEDLRHPLYKDMIKKVNTVFDGYPNLIHLSGHEHGLQFIKADQTQVVSGSGAKRTNVRKKKKLLFGDASQGFVIADQMMDQSIKFTYFSLTASGVQQAFYYTQYYQPAKSQQISQFEALGGDSAQVRVRPRYDEVGKLHRKLFGENYRKEFSALVTLPVIRVSTIYGGLTPLKSGGGMQTISLRLADRSGKEWVIRGLVKNTAPLLPEALRETFARDVLDDYMSAQHPFSPLVVPLIASAAGVPHANPVIGVIAPDTALGPFQKLFSGKIALLEEREPAGKSDNTLKMYEKLKEDNDNHIDSKTLLRARLLDLLLSDWDRHADQWRWADQQKGSGKMYLPVPRDRDQAMYINQGLFPKLASRPWVLPTLQGFDGNIKHVKYVLFKSNFANSFMDSQFSKDEWMSITNDFTKAITDSVVEASLTKMPAAAYDLRHEELARKLKERRNNIPAAMEKFYLFINRIVDIQGTDKNELFEITGTPDAGLHITAKKINKNGKVTDMLMSKTYDPAITKEVRLYMMKGDDSVLLDNKGSSIAIRIIGGEGNKRYHLTESGKKVRSYEREHNTVVSGRAGGFKRYISNDSLNTAFVPVNLYNITMPLIAAGFNYDDGFLMGLGFKHTHQGFRKTPYASVQQLTVAHSFSTRAYRIKYSAEWLGAVGKADLIMQANVFAPNNTVNFFGRGNETEFVKSGDHKSYYRTRFAIYQADPAIRWKGNAGSSFSIGPSVQFYHFEEDENTGRFIENTSLIGSYDSTTISNDKSHIGLVANYTMDKRSHKTFPVWGTYLNVMVQAYKGLNNYSRSFVQVLPEIAFYKSLNAKRTIILAERFGGGVSFGKTTFYQSQFLGGHENLFGYRQYRFAGEHSIYNNLELRIKLADFASYILPGQFGALGLFDVGRVWVKNENSRKWHNGYGGGFYFAPAQLTVFQLVAAKSIEGWYPYFTMKFRF